MKQKKFSYCQFKKKYQCRLYWLAVWVGQMWPDLIAKAKEGGIDVIDTYVFWNGHEPKEGTVSSISYLLHR